MSNEDEKFKQRAKRMKETHVVSLEVYVERLFLREPLAKSVLDNSDNVKIRIKFADLPCVEIDGTYEEEYITLEAASIRTLGGTTDQGLDEALSNRDFFRRGRFTIESERLKRELKRQLMEKRASIEQSTDDVITEPSNKKKVRFSDSYETKTNEEKVKPVEESETTFEVQMDNGIPFNDSKALIFPTTPQQLLYDLIGKPLNIFLFVYVKEGKAVMIGQTFISLYQMSDIVPHMTMIDGGVHSLSKISGTYPLENKEKIEIGGIKVKLRIATFGTCSYAMVRTLDPIHPSIKFMADEIVEDKNQDLPERALRDVASRTAIVTGAENTPEVEILPPPSDKSTENEKIAETFMCLKNWKPIYQRM